MNYYKNNIKHVRGDTYSFGMVVEDEVLDAVYFTCRDGLNDNSPVLFQKSLGNGISITETEEQDDVTLYKYAIRIDPLDTKDINSGTYYYDLQIELNSDVLTIMKGRFIIEQDCTRSEKVIDEIAVKVDTINGEVVGISVMDKLDYLENTKNLIKDSLNYLGEEVSDDDTFRSYADVITGLYDYMEKVTDEGTDVTLTNTRVGPLKLSPKGNTTQNTTTGKNLINPNDTTTSNGITSTYSNNTMAYSGTITGSFAFLTNKINTSLESGDYTFSRTKSLNYTTVIRVYFDETNYQDLTILANSTNRTANFPNNIVAYQIYISNLTSGTALNETIQFQLEKGSTATDYEPYTNGASPNPDYPQEINIVSGDNTITISNEDDTETQTQLISLGNIELCKIGNYQDYLYKSGDKWYMHQVIGKHTFTGTETWTKDSNRFWTGGLSDMLQVSGRINCYFNYFHYEATGIVTGVGFGISSFSGQTGIVFLYPNASITDATGFKTWLSTHNTIVYYPLNTPQDIEITDTTLIGQLDDLDTKLKSYDPQTNITSVFAEGNAQMIISATALKKGGN